MSKTDLFVEKSKIKYTPLIRFKGDGECFLELNDYAKQFFGVAK